MGHPKHPDEPKTIYPTYPEIIYDAVYYDLMKMHQQYKYPDTKYTDTLFIKATPEEAAELAIAAKEAVANIWENSKLAKRIESEQVML